MTTRALLLLTLAAAPASLARAGDDSACARFQEPLAYNACLASHGPRAPGGAAKGAGRGERPAPPLRTASDRSAPAGVKRATLGRGRVHMEFRIR